MAGAASGPGGGGSESGRCSCGSWTWCRSRTDNGKHFTGRFGKPRPAEVLFERILRENGIGHRLTGVRSPTTTGKVERFHKTLQRELLDTLPPLPNAQVAQQVIDAWVDDYNQRRPHQALGGQTPAERFYAKPATDLTPATATGHGG